MGQTFDQFYSINHEFMNHATMPDDIGDYSLPVLSRIFLNKLILDKPVHKTRPSMTLLSNPRYHTSKYQIFNTVGTIYVTNKCHLLFYYATY